MEIRTRIQFMPPQQMDNLPPDKQVTFTVEEAGQNNAEIASLLNSIINESDLPLQTKISVLETFFDEINRGI